MTRQEQRDAKFHGPRAGGHRWTGTPWATHQTCEACRMWSTAPAAKSRCPRAHAEVEFVLALARFFTWVSEPSAMGLDGLPPTRTR